MRTLHFCVESFDPREGGMEESALRLLQCLATEPDLRIVAYVLSGSTEGEHTRGAEITVDVAEKVNKLLTPLPLRSELYSRVRRRETTRMQVMFLRDAMRQVIHERPTDCHVVLSFYISTAGFVAQHVASELRIPHIACSRGSDLARDFFTKDGVAGIEFVLKRASHVVTTNLEHRRFVEDIHGRRGRVHVIYNSVPSHIRPVWRRRDVEQVRLVSLGGYNLKKGTHLLLDSVAQLLDEGLPIQLSLVGPTGPGEWEAVCEPFRTSYGNSILMKGMIERNEVEAFLMAGDVFCSASLSEGCANGTMLALGLGMPIVSTATGALVDLCVGVDHVAMVRPGICHEFTNMLRRVVRSVLDGTLTVNTDQVDKVLQFLSVEQERHQWLALIETAADESRGCRTVATT